MKSYAVLHVEKGSGSGGGLGNHIDRTEGMQHTYPHANPEYKQYNREYIKSGLSLPEAINKRISEGYTQKKGIRSDAVKYVATIFSGSHDKMNEILKGKKLNDWVQQNYNFACKEFGKENIVRFTLHLDEKTPHIHCVFVPLTQDGRLSAKEIVGNKSSLQSLQDRYAEKMESFGLERGEKNTGITHTETKEFYKRMPNIEKSLQNLTIKELLSSDKDKTIEVIQKAFKTLKIDYDLTTKKLQELQNISAAKTGYIKKKDNIINNILDNPNKYIPIEREIRRIINEKKNIQENKKGRGFKH